MFLNLGIYLADLMLFVSVAKFKFLAVTVCLFIHLLFLNVDNSDMQLACEFQFPENKYVFSKFHNRQCGFFSPLKSHALHF